MFTDNSTHVASWIFGSILTSLVFILWGLPLWMSLALSFLFGMHEEYTSLKKRTKSLRVASQEIVYCAIGLLIVFFVMTIFGWEITSALQLEKNELWDPWD